MFHSSSKEYFDIWIGRFRCFVEFGKPGEESRLTFSPIIYPRQRHKDGVLIQKHFRKKGRWYVTKRISRTEEIALATIVNQTHVFLHRLILRKDQPMHVYANANYESGTAWDVRLVRLSRRDS